MALEINRMKNENIAIKANMKKKLMNWLILIKITKKKMQKFKSILKKLIKKIHY